MLDVATGGQAASLGGMTGVSVFASGGYPDHCPDGHELRPPDVIVSWIPCNGCPEALPNNRGHHAASCHHPGCSRRWVDPPHNGEAWGTWR